MPAVGMWQRPLVAGSVWFVRCPVAGLGSTVLGRCRPDLCRCRNQRLSLPGWMRRIGLPPLPVRCCPRSRLAVTLGEVGPAIRHGRNRQHLCRRAQSCEAVRGPLVVVGLSLDCERVGLSPS
jgi:hypothetical protein